MAVLGTAAKKSLKDWARLQARSVAVGHARHDSFSAGPPPQGFSAQPCLRGRRQKQSRFDQAPGWQARKGGIPAMDADSAPADGNGSEDDHPEWAPSKRTARIAQDEDGKRSAATGPEPSRRREPSRMAGETPPTTLPARKGPGRENSGHGVV